jgi:chromate transport protein ChrA
MEIHFLCLMTNCSKIDMASKSCLFYLHFFLLTLRFKIPVVLVIVVCLTLFENYTDQKKKHVHKKL